MGIIPVGFVAAQQSRPAPFPQLRSNLLQLVSEGSGQSLGVNPMMGDASLASSAWLASPAVPPGGLSARGNASNPQAWCTLRSGQRWMETSNEPTTRTGNQIPIRVSTAMRPCPGTRSTTTRAVSRKTVPFRRHRTHSICAAHALSAEIESSGEKGALGRQVESLV